jgi:hypothetical protein
MALRYASDSVGKGRDSHIVYDAVLKAATRVVTVKRTSSRHIKAVFSMIMKNANLVNLAAAAVALPMDTPQDSATAVTNISVRGDTTLQLVSGALHWARSLGLCTRQSSSNTSKQAVLSRLAPASGFRTRTIVRHTFIQRSVVI